MLRTAALRKLYLELRKPMINDDLRLRARRLLSGDHRIEDLDRLYVVLGELKEHGYS